MTRPERAALTALVLITAVTAAWWALALWPLAADAPYWLVRTREVCFGSLNDTLPSRAGWLLLVAEPLTMTAALVVIWPDALTGALAALARSLAGRAALAAGALALFAGAAAAGARVRSVTARGTTAADHVAPPPSTYPRLEGSTPPLGLVDQAGDSVTLEALRGRLVLVTFAYAHCQSICPTVVHEARAAQRRLADRRAALVVVTIDPWRDTPERLATIAAGWQLAGEAHVVSGDTAAVLATLAAWNMPFSRDPATGELAHPSVVYIVDADGRLAYAAAAREDVIVALARRTG